MQVNKIDFETEKFFADAAKAITSENGKSLLNYISKTDVQDSETLKGLFLNLNGEIEIHYFLKLLIYSLLVVIFVKILCNMFSTSFAVKYCTKVLVSLLLIQPFYEIIAVAIDYMRDLSFFLGVLAPTVGIITAAGGNVHTAAMQGLSFSVLISICQIMLNYLLPVVSAFFIGIAIIDAFSDDKKMTSFSQFVRNSFFVVFSVSVALVFIIINFYNKAAIGNDTMSLKTLRLVISNSVPIIGGTIGDAVKLLSGGIASAKSTIGLSSALFILFLFIPYIVQLFIYNMFLNFFIVLCDYFEAGEIKGTLTHLKCAIDFILAAFSAVIILSFINIGIFMNTVSSMF